MLRRLVMDRLGGAVAMVRDCCKVRTTSPDDVVLVVLDKDEALFIDLAFKSCLAQDAADAIVSKIMWHQLLDHKTVLIDQLSRTRGSIPCGRRS